MDFADLDSMLQQARQRVLRLLELHREMAGVIVDAQMLGEAWIARMFRAQALEEVDRLAAAFEQAERFGFEAEMHLAAGLLADAGDVLDAAPEIGADCFQLVGVKLESLERPGQRADARVHALRRQ